MKFVGRDDVKKHFRSSVPPGRDWNYHPSQTVKYAILSHRWLDEGEPTYEEMKNDKATGLGYEKLKNFCEKAQEYNVEFVWSDTCCIDKSSSTELDDSIRSMFRWYRNSTICIVHLAQSETLDLMMSDEWMERGWTLQELLAPQRIKFYNKHWMPLTGDRNDKSRESIEIFGILQRATGIPSEDLHAFYPKAYHRVDERMTWAARRRTTRVEDVAYSLMGIFDVSMQIAYGEGGERAFSRLTEAIMKAGDPSVFNWKGSAASHHTSRAIPQSPQSFVGHPNLGLPTTRRMQLEMTMTSLGLRVPLVLFPLHPRSRTVLGNGYERIVFDCPLCPTIKLDITALQVIMPRPEYHHYALGIVNYSLRHDGSREIVQVQCRSVGLILMRTSENAGATTTCTLEPNALVGLKVINPPEKTFKQWGILHGVGLVKVDFMGVPNESSFYIDREHLEVVYL